MSRDWPSAQADTQQQWPLVWPTNCSSASQRTGVQCCSCSSSMATMHCVTTDAHKLPAFHIAVPTCCPARRAACASRSSSMTAAIPTALVSSASPARQQTTTLLERAAQRAGCRAHPRGLGGLACRRDQGQSMLTAATVKTSAPQAFARTKSWPTTGLQHTSCPHAPLEASAPHRGCPCSQAGVVARWQLTLVPDLNEVLCRRRE